MKEVEGAIHPHRNAPPTGVVVLVDGAPCLLVVVPDVDRCPLRVNPQDAVPFAVVDKAHHLPGHGVGNDG